MAERLTKPQARMLGLLQARGPDRPLAVSGSQLRVAEALQRKGLAVVRIGGSGVAYQAPWWHEVVLNPDGGERPDRT